MSNHDDTWQQLTVAEAAGILGVSTATVRRMVRAGKLAGETVLRPQGKVYVVRLPRHVTAPRSQVASTEQMPPDMPRGSDQWQNPHADSTRATPAEQMMAAWSSAMLTPILAPIVAELTASRQQLVAQAETIGTLRATVATLEAQNATLLGSTAAESPDPIPELPLPPTPNAAPWWKRLVLAVYG
jgi:excisionase family DNA binding protein